MGHLLLARPVNMAVMTWVLDLDGVVWRGRQVVPGSPLAIENLKAAGHRVVYVTNNSALNTAGYLDKLLSYGIETQPQDLIHAGHAVGTLIEPGERVLVCAGAGVLEGIGDKAELIDVSAIGDRTRQNKVQSVDCVVVGIRPDFQFEWLTYAIQAILDGARLIAPSADPLFPVGDSFQIGGGSMIKAIEYATGVEAITAGKPFQPIADVLKERTDDVEVLVGDQVFTDGQLAQKLGTKFGLVLSGVTRAKRVTESGNIPIWKQADTLLDLVRDELEGQQ